MSDQGDEISVRLRVRREMTPDGRPRKEGKWWLAIPIEVERGVRLWMVVNTIATRSVITPPALDVLRKSGLVGADILDLRSRRQDFVLSGVRLSGRLIPEFSVQVRHVPGLQVAENQYLVDGYLGLDVLLGFFSHISVDTRQLTMTLRLKSDD